MAPKPAPSDAAANQSPVPAPGVRIKFRRSRLPSVSPRPAVDNQASPQLESATSLSTPRSTPRDKPLPARPVASLVNGLSPSKDSRGLIDAGEKPLTGFPVLTPRSDSALSHNSSHPSPSPKATPHTIPRKRVPPAATSNTASESTGASKNRETRDSKLSIVTRQPSTSSLDSAAKDDPSPTKAAEASAPSSDAEGDQEDADAQLSESEPDLNTPSYPTRDPPAPPAVNDTDKNDSIISSCEEDVRKDSNNPSATSVVSTTTRPSNFSRLRPGNTMHTGDGARVLTPVEHSGRHHRTASRIPILGARKANIVDISTPTSSGKDHQQPGVSPSFGSRGIVSPNAMKVLDEGMKRRQQKGDNTGARTGSEASSILFSTPNESGSHLTQAASSPEQSTGASCSGEEETLTPAPSLNEMRHGEELDRGAWSEEEQRPYRPPPSCSPYTGPLPTIPSQSVLPTHTDTAHGQPPSTDLAELVQQYSDFDTASDSEQVPRPSYSSRDFDVADNASSAATYESSEEKTSSSSSEGDPVRRATKTEKHRSKTLSQLEGLGRPPTAAPGLAAVSQYFENKISIEDQQMIQETRKPKKESTLAEKIATNHKCLERLGGSMGNANPAREPTDASEAASTPSGYATACGATQVSQDGIEPFPPFNVHANPGSSSNAQQSIASEYSAARVDSPTLANGRDIPKRKPGSVKTARQGINTRYNNYASQTLATQTKRNEKGRESSGLPAPINKFQRGRSQNADNQESRARSRSRKYLDKKLGDLKEYLPTLPGLARRRDKSSIPPVPAIPPNAHVTSSRGRSPYTATAAPSPSASAKDPAASNAAPKSKSPDARKRVEPPARLPGIAESSAPESPSATDEDDMTSNEAITLAQMLQERAQQEEDDERRERLLRGALALNECMQFVKEAKVNAEKAQQAAKEASMWSDLTQRSARLLHSAARTIHQASEHLQRQEQE